jgi:hypothetical protein
MKVRIKKTPRTGDQRDYSLTTHRPWSPSNSEDPNAARNTMGAVPRHMANIEAEGGETILGDINNDGNIEHMTITGKRHTQGGVPLNVPGGSFIFSDTKKMKIKDPEVLKHFGMGGKAGGYTPAQIAKQYQLNDFMKKVNDPQTDPFTRRTAERMLNNNMQKLSELAAYQEGMKGKQPPAVSEQMLPDGGAQMSQAAMPPQMNPEMMGQTDPAMMDELEMAYGGMTKMQTGGGSPLLVPGFQFYVGSQKAKIKSIDDNWIDDNYVHLEKPINGVSKIPLNDFKKHFGSSSPYKSVVGTEKEYLPSIPGGPPIPFANNNFLNEVSYKKIQPMFFGSTPAKDLNHKAALLGVENNNRLQFAPGTEFVAGSQKYKVVDAMLEGAAGEPVIKVTDSAGKTQYLNKKLITSYYKKNQLGLVNKDGSVVPFTQAGTTTEANASMGATRTVYDASGNPLQISINSETPAGYSENKTERKQPNIQKATGNVRQQTSGTPPRLKAQQSKERIYESDEEYLKWRLEQLQDKAMGGELFQDGGAYEQPKYKYDAVQRKMVPVFADGGGTGEKEYVNSYKTKDGKKRKEVTKGNTVTIYDEKNEVVSSHKIENDYQTYSAKDVEDWKKNGIDVTLPESLASNFGSDMTEGRQGARGDSGTYGTQNYWNDKNSGDFKKRHARFVAANPNFNPKKDSGVFQNWYNDDIYNQATKAGYSPEEATGYVNKFGFIADSKDPNAKDGLFGRYTWSRPTINIGKKPPGPQTVYRCPDCQPVQIPADQAVSASDFTSLSACQTACAGKTNTTTPEQKPQDNDFWIQHKLGIANAMNMDRFYGEPAMFQMNGATYDPQLEEYSAKNASLQSDASLAMSNINASADPTTARANIAAVAGQLGQAGLNEIANIQNRNVNTTNAVAADRAHMRNDVNGKNTAMRKQFYDETMNYGQNLVNSSNKQRTMITNSFNNAFQGLQNRNMMRAIYPMYDINSVTGANAFIDGEDFTEGTFQTQPTASTGQLKDIIEKYKSQLMSSGMSPDEATKQAAAFAKDEMNRNHQSSNISRRAYLQQNPQAALAGMTGGYTPYE